MTAAISSASPKRPSGDGFLGDLSDRLIAEERRRLRTRCLSGLCVSTGAKNADVPRLLADTRKQLETAMRERFEVAKAEGDLGIGTDPASLARYIQTVFLGMSLQAAGGATREELFDIAGCALLAWPKPKM